MTKKEKKKCYFEDFVFEDFVFFVPCNVKRREVKFSILAFKYA